MQVEQIDGKVERRICIGMVTDRDVLGKISAKWTKEGLFKNKWCNIVGGWCVRYYGKYGKAPKASIEPLYDKWSKTADKETAKLIDRFLASLSGEYERLSKGSSSSHVVDMANEHFQEVQLQLLSQGIADALERGKAEEAIRQINAFSTVELGEDSTTDVLFDQEALRSAFEQKSEPIINLPGCLGHFLNPALTADSFVSFVAPDKTGKSFWLQELAWIAMEQRKRVAHFIIGDMSKGQILKRYATRASGRPLWKSDPNNPLKFPLSITHVDTEKFSTTTFKERIFKKDLAWGVAWKAFEDVAASRVKSNKSYLKLSCHPGGSISVLGIKSKIQIWERQGWIPEVVVIDYADNLAAIDGKEETRHQVNRTWRELRSLSQEFHNLVITATQSNAAAYNAYVIKREHFSESKMKNAHVSAMVGINQCDEEKELDITRLNFVQLREHEFNVNKCVHVAGCRAIGRMVVKSCY